MSNCLALHTQGDYVSFPSQTFANTTTVSWMAWVKFANSVGASIIRTDANSINLNEEGQIIGKCFHSGEQIALTSPLSYADVEWHFVMMVRNGTVVTLYVDNVAVASSTFSANTVSSYSIGGIGRAAGGSASYKGLIRGVRMFDIALDASARLSLYNGGVFVPGSGAETGLIAGYNLNEGTGSTVADFSGNGNTGTINNPNSVYSNWLDGDRSATATRYVSETGSITNDGLTDAAPWPLQYALNHPPDLIPGDRLKLIDGSAFVGSFDSYITGTASAPIWIEPVTPGVYPPTVSIDGYNTLSVNVLDVFGQYAYFKDLEIGNITTFDRANLGNSINNSGKHVKFINCRVHDLGNAFFTGDAAVGGEYYGNVIYNIGRKSGYGFYVQNAFPENPRLYRHNFISNSVGSQGVHVYRANGSTVNAGHHFEENCFVNNSARFGNGVKSDITLIGSHLYNSGVIVDSSTADEDLTITDSVLSKSEVVLSLGTWNDLTFRRNKVIGQPSSTFTFIVKYTNVGQTLDFDENVYWRGLTSGGSDSDFAVIRDNNNANPVTYKFSGWQGLGHDANSTHYNNGTGVTRPSSTYTPYEIVALHPNQYQSGRANIYIWNYGQAGTPSDNVDVDLATSGLVGGQDFRVVNVLSGEDVLIGTYDSGNTVVSVPMNTDTDVYAYVGTTSNPVTYPVPSTPVTTLPTFGAFLVIPGASGAGTPNTPTVLSVVRTNVNGQLKINVTLPVDADDATLAYSIDGGAFTEVPLALAAFPDYILDTSANPGKTYAIRVKCSNESGDSLWSETITRAATVVHHFGLRPQIEGSD